MGLREPNAPREPGISRLNRISIVECGEPLVDIRDVCTGLLINATPTLLRQTAARMLQQAHESLPAGIGLKVNTALRMYTTQCEGYFGHLEKLREEHPGWPASILRREANKFWHPPDQPIPPGHCTGGAVDVTLVDKDGTEYDMVSTLRPNIKTHATYVLGLTPAALTNRKILIAAMAGAGFSNCADEWWHWSYGDNGWACRLGLPNAIYGAVPECLEPVPPS